MNNFWKITFANGNSLYSKEFPTRVGNAFMLSNDAVSSSAIVTSEVNPIVRIESVKIDYSNSNREIVNA
jgi:hypothetical protein